MLAFVAAMIFATPVAAQSDSTGAERVREGSLPVAFLLVEAVAFGSGAAARSETGARIVGSVQGLSGLTLLGIAALSDRRTGRPELTVPYGLGLLALSSYNVATASSRNDDARFWANALGFNVTVLAGVLSARLLHNHSVSVQALPSGFAATVRF